MFQSKKKRVILSQNKIDLTYSFSYPHPNPNPHCYTFESITNIFPPRVDTITSAETKDKRLWRLFNSPGSPFSRKLCTAFQMCLLDPLQTDSGCGYKPTFLAHWQFFCLLFRVTYCSRIQFLSTTSLGFCFLYYLCFLPFTCPSFPDGGSCQAACRYAVICPMLPFRQCEESWSPLLTGK